MTIGLIFWILMLIWLVFTLWWNWPIVPGAGAPWAGSAFIFILFLLLGWAVFGAPVRG